MTYNNTVNAFILLCSEWDKERYKAESKGKKPSLGKAIFRAFGKAYIMLGLFAVVIVSDFFQNFKFIAHCLQKTNFT